MIYFLEVPKLSDLEEDYQSVSGDLRVELDAPTKNRLEKRLNQIGQALEETEQQIARLLQPE